MRKINSDLPYYIDSFTVNSLIDKINEVGEDSQLSWNSLGGSTWAGQQFIDFLNNKENKLTANVTGIVASMGAVSLPFFDEVIGAKESDIMIHSVSGGPNAKQTNQFLYKALAKKINEPVFKQITGYELKDVMMAEGEDRIDVWFTGDKARKMGLFDKVYSLLDQPKNNLFESLDETELGYELPEHVKVKLGLVKENKQEKTNQISTNNKNDMEIKDVTASLLQTGNPEVYNSISEKAAKAERERVSEILKYAEFDFKKANELINSGEKLAIADVEYFMEKKFNKSKVDELEDNNTKDFVPAKKTASEEEKEKEAALEELRERTGINSKLNIKK